MTVMRPLYVGRLTEDEIKKLKQGLRSSSAFTVRRCQILLKSGQWQTPSQIAQQLSCSDQTVRQAIRAYHQEGSACLQEKSHARHNQAPSISQAGQARLTELIRLSPRTFGYETSVWTRSLLAERLYQEGHSNHQVSPSTITLTLQRIGIRWRRAKQWVRSPDPHYEQRKKDETS